MSTMPLFQAAQRGQRYEEPDFDAIERERELVDAGLDVLPQTYIPEQVSRDEAERIKEEMRANRVQVTPDNFAHALEAEEIRKFLRRFSIPSIRKVSGTRDRRGTVKLTFSEFRRLSEALMHLDPASLDTKKD